jgi:D-threo-aldose 1-dehydrogenase
VTPAAPRTRRLGRSAIDVTALGLGSASLGNLYQEISEATALSTVDAAWAAGVRYFDTAPHYGLGLAERRLGEALRDRPRAEYVLSTKVGRILVDDATGAGSRDLANGFDVPASVRRVWDFSAGGVRRGLAESLDRLGLSRVDLVLLHDPEESDEPGRALTEAYPALETLRSDGVVGAIGVGSKSHAVLARYATGTDVDCVMVAGRYTLLEQPALDVLLPVCERRGVAVLNVGVFNSGLLALPAPVDGQPYEYAPAPPAVLARARRIAAVCDRHGVSLPRAALAFAAAPPAVVSVVVGAADAAQATTNAELFASPPPPPDLWADLVAEGLLRPDAPTPGPAAGI